MLRGVTFLSLYYYGFGVAHRITSSATARYVSQATTWPPRLNSGPHGLDLRKRQQAPQTCGALGTDTFACNSAFPTCSANFAGLAISCCTELAPQVTSCSPIVPYTTCYDPFVPGGSSCVSSCVPASDMVCGDPEQNYCQTTIAVDLGFTTMTCGPSAVTTTISWSAAQLDLYALLSSMVASSTSSTTSQSSKSTSSLVTSTILSSTSSSPSSTVVTPSSMSSTPSQAHSSDLGGGAYAGIGVGATLGVFAVVGLLAAFYILRRRKRRQIAALTEPTMQTSETPVQPEFHKTVSERNTVYEAWEEPTEIGEGRRQRLSELSADGSGTR